MTYSCCSATPEKIDKAWLKSNSGQFFNTPTLHHERNELLKGNRVPSCNGCWNAEDRGVVSRRLLKKSNERTHTDINSTPSVINIIAGTDCNLTCSYCCKQYSSAWADDLVKNGDYIIGNENNYPMTYSMSTQDTVIYKLSQKEMLKLPSRELIINEIGKLPSDLITISGGEPFLYLDLSTLVNNLSSTKMIHIMTGLGVNSIRLAKELDKIKSVPNLEIVVSAENIGALYEFNRYGNSYEKFLNNLEIIKQSGIPFSFSLTLSNITLFGLAEFMNEFKEYKFKYNMCTDPEYLSVNVMDDVSKQAVLNSLQLTGNKDIDDVIDSISLPCTQTQKTELASFINEFARRRNLTLDIFPKTFIDWMNE